MRFRQPAAALAFVLASIPAARASIFAGSPAQVSDATRAQLLGEIGNWRALELSDGARPAERLLQDRARLDRIEAGIKAAEMERDLDAPSEDFAAWKARVLSEKRGAVASPASTDAQADASRERAALEAVQRAARQAQAALGSAPGAFFDGAASRAGSDPVAAPAPEAAPERYAKARRSLVEDGADPRIVDLAIEESLRQQADPLLVLSLVKKESDFNPRARSSRGARGLMQLMPGTARGLGVRDARKLYDERTNLRAGVAYLMTLWDQFTDMEMSAMDRIDPSADRGVRSVLAAYNAGPGAVERFDGVPPYRETQGYVETVLGYYRELRASL